MSWLAGGYELRQKIPIERVPNAGTNYVIKVIVHYATGTPTAGHVWCDSQCWSDFRDIRFTDTENNLLSYWLEAKSDSDWARFWVKVTENLSYWAHAEPTTGIRIYYGNPSTTTTTSDGDATFIFFDDFLGTDWDAEKWEDLYTLGHTTVSIADSVLSMRCDCPESIWSRYSSIGGTAKFQPIEFSSIRLRKKFRKHLEEVNIGDIAIRDSFQFEFLLTYNPFDTYFYIRHTKYEFYVEPLHSTESMRIWAHDYSSPWNSHFWLMDESFDVWRTCEINAAPNCIKYISNDIVLLETDEDANLLVSGQGNLFRLKLSDSLHMLEGTGSWSLTELDWIWFDKWVYPEPIVGIPTVCTENVSPTITLFYSTKLSKAWKSQVD